MILTRTESQMRIPQQLKKQSAVHICVKAFGETEILDQPS